jgi:hypothetical protein
MLWGGQRSKAISCHRDSRKSRKSIICISWRPNHDASCHDGGPTNFIKYGSMLSMQSILSMQYRACKNIDCSCLRVPPPPVISRLQKLPQRAWQHHRDKCPTATDMYSKQDFLKIIATISLVHIYSIVQCIMIGTPFSAINMQTLLPP